MNPGCVPIVAHPISCNQGRAGVEPLGIWPNFKYSNYSNSSQLLQSQSQSKSQEHVSRHTLCICNTRIIANLFEIEQHRKTCRFSCMCHQENFPEISYS